MNTKQIALLTVLFLWFAVAFLKESRKVYPNPEHVRATSLEDLARIPPEVVKWHFTSSDIPGYLTLTVPPVLVSVPLFLWFGYNKKKNKP